jgi:tetratricopeptide (TPR) repeat protein
MRVPKLVESLLRISTAWIPGLGTAVEEGLEHWGERQDRRSLLSSLLDLKEQRWRPDASPAALLRADFGVVPFHGREAELEELARWCDSERPLALRLYTAPGGFGKTRLLRHFVRIRRAEWDAGFLPEGVLRAEAVSALLSDNTKPLLLVLDYAESRVSELEAVLLAARETPRRRLRIVLLARSEGDWWNELKRAGGGVGDFFQGPAVEGPLPLPPLTDSSAARHTSFQNAVHAFAKALGKEREATLSTAPPLDDQDFERVLLVHAAALATVEGELVSSDNLLDWLLTREERGIDRVREKQAGLGPEIQRATYQAAALVTLAQGADSRGETVEILSRTPSLRDQPCARREQIAEVLHVLYRGRRWCDGIEPDLLGEHWIASRLDEAPELLDAAFGQNIPASQLEAGLTVLNRLAQRRSADRRFLEETIGRGLRHLALPAVRVGVAGGDPVGIVLADVLSCSGDVQVAKELEEQLPEHTTSLREVAAQVEEMLWRDLMARVAEPVEIARRSASLSIRLADVGRYEDALAAIQKAVDIDRELADTQPDAFRPGLASSLNNFSNRLADVGRREEALNAIREGVEIYRNLADQESKDFTPELAASLTNLSNRFTDVGWHDEALKASREAVDIYRRLAESRPDAFRPNLAVSLNNHSNALGAVGREEESLEAIRESVKIYRDFAQERPDAFRPAVAPSLVNLAAALFKAGQHEEALDKIREAIEIYRDLSAARPDAFRNNLAQSLTNFSYMLTKVGRREEGVKAGREAVEIYTDLAEAQPDAFRPGLAMSLNNYSDALATGGWHEAGLESVHKAIQIYRDLAETWPDAFSPPLAMSLGLLQKLLRNTGQIASAFRAIQESLDLLEPLFIQLPEAYAASMQTVAGDYERTATVCGVEPDRERLHRIREILAALQAKD